MADDSPLGATEFFLVAGETFWRGLRVRREDDELLLFFVAAIDEFPTYHRSLLMLMM
jgi:hypothetical protein